MSGLPSRPHLRVYRVLDARPASGLHFNRNDPAVVAEQIKASLDAVPLRQSCPVALVTSLAVNLSLTSLL